MDIRNWVRIWVMLQINIFGATFVAMVLQMLGVEANLSIVGGFLFIILSTVLCFLLPWCRSIFMATIRVRER